MKIVLIAVGKTTTEYISEGVAEYFKRLNRYVQAELTVIPDVRWQKVSQRRFRSSAKGNRYSLRCKRAI